MAFDIKAATPDASFDWSTAGLFGADSQAATDPSYFSASVVRTALLALANTWSANAAASIPPILLSGTWFTGGSATTTKPTLLVEPAGTTSTGWSTSGTGLGVNAPTGFVGDLVSLQFNGVARTRVTAEGRLIVGRPAYNKGMPHLSSVNDTDTGFSWESGNLYCSCSGASVLFITSSTFNFRANASVGWSSGQPDEASSDTHLFRDAAGVVAQRNGVNAQSLRVYGTFTDSSNYERGALNAGADYIELAAETAGTGDDNLDVRLTPAGTGNVRFGTHAGIGIQTVTGYIEIKDAGGTARRLAVVS